MNNYLPNRRKAFRGGGGGSASTWTFDITRTTFSDMQPRSIYRDANRTQIANQIFAMYITSDSSALIFQDNNVIRRSDFDVSHPFDLTYINDVPTVLADNIYRYAYNTRVGFDPEGTHLVTYDYSNTSSSLLGVKERALPGAWDFSDNPTSRWIGWDSAFWRLDVTSDDFVRPVFFSEDGRHMFRLFGNQLRNYTLSTPFDLETLNVGATIVNFNQVLGSNINPSMRDAKFSPDGLRLVTANATHLDVFDFGEPYDPASGVVWRGAFATGFSNMQNIAIERGGTRLFCSTEAGVVYGFNLNE